MNFTATTTTTTTNMAYLLTRQVLSLRDVQILVLAIAVFVVIRSLRQRKSQGLPSWPLLGMLPSIVAGLTQSNMCDWLTEILCRNGGTFHFSAPVLSNLKCVVTADPRNLEHLLKSKFENYPKGGYFRNTLKDFLGEGIFNADDDTWQQQRKTASIVFHSARFRQLTIELLLELVHGRLLKVLEESVNTAMPIDLQDVMLRLTFDNISMIAFGVDPGCLSPGLPKIPFVEAFEKATEASLLRFVTPVGIWKTMKALNLGPEKELNDSIKDVNKFADEVIRTRKKELSLVDEKDKNSSHLLTVFMRLKDENGKSFSDKFLRDICVNLILAGRDNSAVALSWLFWLINQHPEVEEKILAEICTIISKRDIAGKKDNTSSLASLVFTPEEVKKMEYLQAAISEALRLYPSVPVDHKEVLEDDVFPDGTVLKKGTKVIYAIYSMGRMEAIWGKDCREYKPERWLSDGRFMSESAYKFTAFNGGPRLCLGKDFAYYQMKFVAASIIYRYQVKVVKDHRVEPKFAMMSMKHGLKVTLIRRNESELH